MTSCVMLILLVFSIANCVIYHFLYADPHKSLVESSLLVYTVLIIGLYREHY
jgi:hypothetical protein